MAEGGMFTASPYFVVYTYLFFQITVKPYQGLLTGKVRYLLFPISEPVGRGDDGHPGDHWTLGVLNCRAKEAVYYNSLPHAGSKGFELFQKVSAPVISLCAQLRKDLVT